MSTSQPPRVIEIPGDEDLEQHPAIAEGAELLRRGELVAFPTETVYGLGADAASAAAVERVFAAKRRPADNPLIVHLASASDLSLVSDEVPEQAMKLAMAFWPGPLTLVLPAREALRDAACRGLPSVAVRVPDHPVALALLRAARIPVAAPSANLSGSPSPTRAADVVADLGHAGSGVSLILDGGPCRIGIESTVLDLSGEWPQILRPGAVTAEQLSAVLGEAPRVLPVPEALLRSPGTRHRHYQPRTPVILVGPGVGAPALARALQALPRAGYLGQRDDIASLPGITLPPGGSRGGVAARTLYATLRDLDALGLDVLLVDAVSEEGSGVAVMDRLRRAAKIELVTDEDTTHLGLLT